MDDDTIVAFTQGDLDEPSLAAAEQHLQVCKRCRLFVSEVVRSLDSQQGLAQGQGGTGQDAGEPGDGDPFRREDGRTPRLEPGTLVGRYAIERYLAQGGGGTVYEARDSQLGRKVALKLLALPRAQDHEVEAVRARLLREAQAMALLSHPNVVQVHDVGVVDGQIFIVTEFVAGETLTVWLRRKARPWREIVAAFSAAGEGLAAIHDAGLAHGDFKPDNVLVAGDGRPRITDFGLARPVHAAGLASAGSVELESEGDQVDAAGGVTLAGGTLLYMAPELAGRGAANASTDQFSFCVALHVALCGRHPSGDGLLELLARRQALPSPADAPPPALLNVLLRGVTVTPKERYPSMRALAAALQAVARPRRWWRQGRGLVATASGALVLLALAAGGFRAVWAPALRGPVCGDGNIQKPIEECDDGNRDNGDGCTATCRSCEGDPKRFFYPDTGQCFVWHDTPVDWGSADEICAGAGSVLATYEQVLEANSVLNAFRAAPSWIGLRWNDRSGGLIWATEQPLAPGLRQSWGGIVREASRSCVRQHWSVTPRVDRLQGRWLGTACDERLPFVCKEVDWLVDPGTGQAYRFFYDRQSWDSARGACEKHGGHLATLTSEAELEFVTRRLPGEGWIGATDAAQEASFTWVTREPFVFSRFFEGELRSKMARQHDCVVLGFDGVWHDRHCGRSFSYMCEIDEGG